MKAFLILLFIFPPGIYSQVGIGTTEPGAQLDIVATNKENPASIDGILIPRISKFPAQNPGLAQHGMLVFLSKEFNNFPVGFYYWHQQESKWKSIVADAKAANFYKTGTTESPGNIEDAIFRKGNLGLGTEEIESKLQIAINPGDPQDIKKGLEIDNNNAAEDNLTTYGILNQNRSSTNGPKYGIKTNVSGTGTGIHYGIHSITSHGSGTSDIYGIYNRVGRTEGANSENFGIYSKIGEPTGRGSIYGIYAVAYGNPSSRVFAGYFAGRVGIGITPAVEYIFPDSRGKEGDILVSDAQGKVSWKANHTRNYETTGNNPINYTIGPEVYYLRVYNSVSKLILPDASSNKGRELVLIGWQYSGSTPLDFQIGDTLYDLQNDTDITSLVAGEILTIISIGNKWLLIDRKSRQ